MTATEREREADDALDTELAALPRHDVGTERARVIRERAHVALAGGGWTKLVRIERRVLEPLFVAAVAVAYLGWALDSVLALYR
jgi:hypothetical protein